MTGTDTGVGKTVLAAALAAALRRRAIEVAAIKPVMTGLEQPDCAEWPQDHELLARAAGVAPEAVVLESFGPPVSPHLAAELAHRPIDHAALVARIYATARTHELVVVEGVGGLLVPLTPRYDVRDLAASLGLPLLIAARPGLGTINHTLLTLAAARAAGLRVLAVVLTPWPQSPGEIERSNLATIAALGRVAVGVLPQIERPEVRLLAEAAEALPIGRWLADWLHCDGEGECPAEAGVPVLVAAASDRPRE